MGKKILITGGLGLLGKPLVSFLRKKKNSIYVLDKSKNKKKNKLINKNGISFVYGNFQNKYLLNKKNKEAQILIKY